MGDETYSTVGAQMKMTCKCGKEYTLGVDGTVDGCDACEGITRNLAGQIIYLLLLMLMLAGCATPTPTPKYQADARVKGAVVLQVEPTPQIETGEVCGTVNVRRGAAAEGAVIRYLVDGATVEIYERTAGWVRIGKGEWITARALCP